MSAQSSEQNDDDEGRGNVGRAAFVVVVASLVGLVVGVAIEALGQRKGRVTLAKRSLKVADHAFRGFALGSLTAATFFKISRDEKE